jgi:hypothetical protein
VTILKNNKIGSLGSAWGTITATDPKLTIASVAMMRDESSFIEHVKRALPMITHEISRHGPAKIGKGLVPIGSLEVP